MSNRIFRALTVREALRKVRDALGPDAMILAQARRDGFVEITACDGAAADAVASTRRPVQSITGARARDDLAGLGFDADFVDSVLSGAPTPRWVDVEATARALLPAAPRPAMLSRGRVRLIGPPGAGKTTAIVRLAAQHVLHHGTAGIALVSEDTARLGGSESLLLAGELLRIPVFEAADAAERDRILTRVGDRALVLLDTPGIVASAPALDPLPGFETFLTLPATFCPKVLTRLIAATRPCGPVGALVTHADSVERIGGVLSVLWREGLGIAWSASGADPSAALDGADREALWHLAVRGSAARPGEAPDGGAGSRAHTLAVV